MFRYLHHAMVVEGNATMPKSRYAPSFRGAGARHRYATIKKGNTKDVNAKIYSIKKLIWRDRRNLNFRAFKMPKRSKILLQLPLLRRTLYQINAKGFQICRKLDTSRKRADPRSVCVNRRPCRIGNFTIFINPQTEEIVAV